ncbi:MAG TPA: hypothetical protein VFP50_15525 [Anaeromyxobacteraceae bacterium]|nr:hypothetical protein [Anaeromyxobacteraceae bacterium]
MDQQTPSKLVDPSGNPIPPRSAALATQPVRIDAGRLDLLDPELPDEGMVRQLEQRALFRERIIQLALRQTAATQYVIHRAEGDEARESVYPMGAAADAMFSFLGLTWASVVESTVDGRPSYRRGEQKWQSEIRSVPVKDGKGNVVGEDRYYWVKSGLWSRDALVALAEGKRLIGVGYSKDEPTTEMNAFENLKSRAVREVLGLKGKDRTWYKVQGLDLSAARVAEFQDRKAGASSDPDQAVIKWGKAKGKKVSELSDDDLRFYTERQEKDCADPEKAKFKPERLLAALKAEAERRAAKPTEDAESAEEFDRTIIALREEMLSQRVDATKLDAYVATLQTLEQARRALEHYRGKRAKKTTSP